MIVIDANIAAKWFLPEEGSEQAAQLLHGSHKLLAPDLIRIEVAAAITRRARLGHIPQEQAELSCQAWFDAIQQGVVSLIPSHTALPDVVKLALQLNHPLQDCLYLAIAIRMQAPLITDDAKFIERAKPAYPNIRALIDNY